MAKKEGKENIEPEVAETVVNSTENKEQVVDNEEEANKGEQKKGMKSKKQKVAALAKEVEDLGTELEASKMRAQEANDQYVRLLAEFDNFRKRTRREMGTLQEYASENVLTALLPVLDDFERSLTAMEKTDNLSSMKEGVKMVADKLHRVLEKEGLNGIDSLGSPFDSEMHEAIHSIEVPEEDKKGKVIEEVEKGYRLKDKVIRYSKVIVGE